MKIKLLNSLIKIYSCHIFNEIMKTTVNLFGANFQIEIKKSTYAMGNAIVLEAVDSETGDPFGMITVNGPGISLGPDEICVKTYSENEWVLQLLTLLPNNFKDTGKSVEIGFATAPIWQFKQ